MTAMRRKTDRHPLCAGPRGVAGPISSRRDPPLPRQIHAQNFFPIIQTGGIGRAGNCAGAESLGSRRSLRRKSKPEIKGFKPQGPVRAARSVDAGLALWFPVGAILSAALKTP